MRESRNLIRVIAMVLGVAVPSLLTASEEKPQLGEIEQRVRAVYETVLPAIVRIMVVGESHEWYFSSGVILTADGYVVTWSYTDSPVREGTAVAFYFADGRRATGSVLGWSGEWQIRLMKITENGPWPHVKLGKAADVKAGQVCVSTGYEVLPGGEFEGQPFVCLGCVTKSAVPVWFTSSCATGCHGAGVFDLEGRLLGVTTIVPADGDLVHTSMELVRTHWDDLVAGKNLDAVRLLFPGKAAGESPRTIGSKPQPTSDQDRAAAAVAKAKPASVRIRRSGEDKGWSGVIVTSDGYVITCAHAGQLPGDKVTISLPDGRDVAGKALGTNCVSDVGLVKITEEGPWPHVELGNSTVMRPGDPCLMMGYPADRRDRQPLVRTTQIAEQPDEGWSCLLTSSSFRLYGGDSESSRSYGGDSGGGIFDLEGRVVAVHLGGEDGDVRRHARVELFHKQWDFLAASKPVDVISSEALGEITGAFRHLANDLGPIVVEVLGNKKQRALGTVVGSNGRILTKASELSGTLSCRFGDGRILPAAVQKVSREHDLAVLKVEARNLPQADWSKSDIVSRGTLIAALIPGKPPLVGVVSQAARPIPPDRGWFSVNLGDSDRGLEVWDDSQGRQFDVPVREGDIIVHVKGHPTPDLKTYLKVLEPEPGVAIGYPGDAIRLGVKRGDETLEFSFPLPPQPYAHQDFFMSGRCSAFPSVFDTHIRLTPKMCGGPVIDNTGRVAGIAIACRKQGWICVIPAAVARKVFHQLSQ